MARKKKPETPTFAGLTASRPYSTIRFFYNRPAAVRYAKDMLTNLANVSPLTIIIEQDGSEEFYVGTVTGIPLADIQTLVSSKREQITSQALEPNGSSQ